MRTTLSHSLLLLTIALGLAAGSPAFAGKPGHHFGGNSGGGNNGGMSGISKNFNQRSSNGSNSGNSMNMKKFTPNFQQFNNNSNKPKINLNGIHSNHSNTVKKQNGFPGVGQFGQNGQIPSLGNKGSKPIVKLPGFGQGNGSGNNGIGKSGLGIGIGVGGGNGSGHGHGQHKNSHHHLGCYPWWKGHGYCGGYSHGCKTVIVQPIVTPVAVLAPELANLPTLRVGAKLTMQSSAFSPEVGVVMLQVDKLMFAVQVDDWQAGAVSFTVPVLMLTGPVKADLVAIDAAGNVLVAQGVMLVAAPEMDQTAAINAQ